MNQAENVAVRPALGYALFLLLVTVLIYAQSLRFPFLFLDDTPFIVQNQTLHQWSSVPSFFFPSAADAADRRSRNLANFYRPAVSLWLLLNYKLFGLHAVLWRATALLLYSFAVWLFWRLARKLTEDDFIALAAALLFALHPLHVEGVTWLSGACVELLLCIFFLGGFLTYLRWRETKRLGWLLLCGTLIFFTLLAKETGVALPVLLVAHAVVFRAKDESGGFRWLALLAALVVPVALYAALRLAALHGVAAPVSRHVWGDVLRSAPLFFLVYLLHAIWPVHLANWYDTQIVSSLSLMEFYLPLALCLVYAGVMIWALLRKPLIGFLLLWWTVLLVPALLGTLNFVDNEYIHDRFTFIALAGLCILAANALRSLPGPNLSLFGFRAASVTGLVVIVIVLGALTATQVSTWRSDFAMELQAVEASPRAVRPRILLANELQKNNNRVGALALYREALNIDPNAWETLFAYGLALANDGDRSGAVRVLSHGLEVAPSKPVFYLILADILADAQRFEDASKLLQSGLSKAEQPELLRGKLAQIEAQALRSGTAVH